MIRETDLSLFVPSPELLIRLASGEAILGVRVGPPRIRVFRETYFDTPEQALRRRGMTCKLRQGPGESPTVVVTVGEGPDSEGITSRTRITAAAVGIGIFETLRGSSEVAAQIQKFMDPSALRPQVALEIQRLGRIHRRGIFRQPALYFYFDRITAQMGGGQAVLNEFRIRRHRSGGPLIRELGQKLKEEYHLFPDGLTTLQRAYRVLATEGMAPPSELSPYALSLALAVFHEGRLGLVQRDHLLCIPTFRGSGEDAARALLADLSGSEDQPLFRLGSTEPREGRPILEVWVAPDPPGLKEEGGRKKELVWYPWHSLLELAGRGGLRDPDLLSTLLLLTRRRLRGELDWIPSHPEAKVPAPLAGRGPEEGKEDQPPPRQDTPSRLLSPVREGAEPEMEAVDALLPFLRDAERGTALLGTRLRAVTDFSTAMRSIFNQEVRKLKGRILSPESTDGDPELILLLDLLSVRIRGMVDRVYHLLQEDLLPALEERRVYLRAWSGLMHEDRRILLEEFTDLFLPKLQILADWGPAFIPEMPPAGCAVGLTARLPGSEATRFFHVVLGEHTPSFLQVPGSRIVLPMEEVIRGLLFTRYPELEKAETHLFRFRTAEVTVREIIPIPIVTPAPEEGVAQENGRADEDGMPQEDTVQPEGEPTQEDRNFPEATPGQAPEPPPPPPLDPPPPGTGGPAVRIRETQQSVVVKVTTHRTMPERHQAQLLRALERQVSRRSPLIGWSDLYTVSGPMDLSELAKLEELDD